jgi:hypothetical protein
MSWLSNDFFIEHQGVVSSKPERPIGQGDVFLDVPVAGRTTAQHGRGGLQVKSGEVIVVASSCGMRKQGGVLNDVVHVAPVSRLGRLAPSWSDGWEEWLHVLPLPGLRSEDEEALAGNLARIGLCGSDTLLVEKRIACVSLNGMRILKARLSGYFTRQLLPPDVFETGAHKEWHELDLWERWTTVTGSSEGFQAWLDEPNPSYPERRRRDTIYEDIAALRTQLEHKVR